MYFPNILLRGGQSRIFGDHLNMAEVTILMIFSVLDIHAHINVLEEF